MESWIQRFMGRMRSTSPSYRTTDTIGPTTGLKAGLLHVELAGIAVDRLGDQHLGAAAAPDGRPWCHVEGTEGDGEGRQVARRHDAVQSYPCFSARRNRIMAR